MAPRRLSILAFVLVGAAVLSAAAPNASHGARPAQQGRPTATPALTPGALTRAAIDAELTLHWSKIENWMSNYAAARGGRYFQALRSHAAVPANGLLAAPDKLSARPSDQTETLAELWNGAALPAAVPFALTVNVYDGPEGRGFELVIEMHEGGQLWRRVVNSGPEVWRAQAWAPVDVAAP